MDDTGSSIGEYNSNSMLLDTKVYDVMFPDGAVLLRYVENVIAESLCENADDDARRYLYMDEIICHKKLDLAAGKAMISSLNQRTIC